MSYKVSIPRAPASDISDDSSVSDDGGCSDWASSFGEALHTKSLFDDVVLPTPEKALEYDLTNHKFDFKSTYEKFNLDLYGRMRLINYIRKKNLNVDQINSLESSSAVFIDDAHLIPVIVDDPLLQLDFDDSWSDDDVPAQAGPSRSATELEPTDGKIKRLEAELTKSRADLAALQLLVGRTLGGESEEAKELIINGPGIEKGKGKEKEQEERDDDTHYFDSYAVNDIHEIMLKDTTRTVSYARFLLSNPQIFKGAIVLDVGCGTGVLSMLAAKAGAKHVYAIEASGFAVKARENIKGNGFENVITVIQGKVEDIDLPVKEVDVIVSEWMGYMLLYESMLDSVLVARDRFLAPSGLMVPSQTRLVISAITGERVWNERVAFWKSVYGFDMSIMNPVYFEEGLVEYVDKEEVMTTEYIVRDINSHIATPKSLDFHVSFNLQSTASKRTTIKAFLTHFDTFFSPTSGEESHVPITEDVEILPFGDDDFKSGVAALDGSSNQVSFTTGPRGKITHWKQVVFLLREPIVLAPGDEINGRFFCRKSVTNSRELDVEIHFTTLKADVKPVFTVQTYKVR
ncbi:type I protein arginine methyltransferase, partial [Tremellales sp. Uapishka_1]